MLTTAAPALRTALAPSATTVAGRAARSQAPTDREDTSIQQPEHVPTDRPTISGVVDTQRYRRYLVGKAALGSATMGAVVSPPLYLLYAARRGFSLPAALRTSWALPFIGGLMGASTCAYKIADQAPLTTFRAAEKLRADAHRVRTEDYFLMGASVGALVVPALFMRRAGILNGIFGGASLGGAAGVVYDMMSRMAPLEGEPGQLESVFASPSVSSPSPTL